MITRILVSAAALFATVVVAAATPSVEIEALLHYIGGLEGASFIRNGSDHTPAEAEAHLRLKWSKQTSDIATAEDFIRLCGTKSSMSGEAYVIRFKDGHSEECAQVLSRQLAVIRAKAKPKDQGTPTPPPGPKPPG